MYSTHFHLNDVFSIVVTPSKRINSFGLARYSPNL
nr:MAG TPA: hypothetical protein [Caudoviricetes sp.]